MALARLELVERRQCVHLLGPAGTGKHHLAIAIGYEAVKAGKSVLVATQAEREGRLRERVKFLRGYSLLIVDEVGYLPGSGGVNLFQLVNACFELYTLKFIADGANANAVVIGKPSIGKSHVAKAVAYRATPQGHDVRHVEADTEFARFALASPERAGQPHAGYIEADLLVLDDLFLARRISEAAAELLRSFGHQRYKRRGSIVVTSSRVVVQGWGKYLPTGRRSAN